MFTALFLTAYIVAWCVCGLVPWVVVSVATRGEAGLGMLPLAVFSAVVGALAVPLLVRDDGPGLILSFAAAVCASAALLAIRHFAFPRRARGSLPAERAGEH